MDKELEIIHMKFDKKVRRLGTLDQMLLGLDQAKMDEIINLRQCIISIHSAGIVKEKTFKNLMIKLKKHASKYGINFSWKDNVPYWDIKYKS